MDDERAKFLFDLVRVWRYLFVHMDMCVGMFMLRLMSGGMSWFENIW